ncbi:MAG: alpha/beta hydrolase [Myxococcales bacterium]|nr:alpha/beta hydrolase [Myxococcales bacterium]
MSHSPTLLETELARRILASAQGPLSQGIERLGRAALARPPYRTRWAGLDPGCAGLLLARKLLRQPDLATLTPRAARRALREQYALVDGPAPAIATVDETVALPSPGGVAVPVRVYRPLGNRPGGPALIWLHGGGFVVGDFETHDAACRRLCADLALTVIAADYRLAPEYPFPAAWDDALTVFDWVRREAATLGVAPERIAMGGDSAGGALTASVAIRRRGQLALQVLLYPGTDFTRSMPSHETRGQDFLLDKPLLDWFLKHTFRPEELRDPRASVYLEPDLTGVAPAIVATAGFDPLCDEGDAYAERLRAAGVPVEHWCEVSLVHGTHTMTGALRSAARATSRLHAAIARRLLG